MPITYTTTQLTVKQLIQWREKGKLGIPMHQRGYVWDLKHQKSLLDTIYRGLPISSLTLSIPIPNASSFQLWQFWHFSIADLFSPQ
jgi:uncharacterized protein with ParB-like and HNH nuclease domain